MIVTSRIRALRETLAARRRTLAMATNMYPPQSAQSSSSMLISHSHPSSASPPSISTSPSTPSKPSPLSNRRLSSNARHPIAIPITKSRDTTSSTSTPRSISTPPSTSPQARAPYLSRPLSQPQTAPPTPPPALGSTPGDTHLAQQITEADSNLVLLSDTIARARNGLVQELVEVFSVVEVSFLPISC